MVGMSLLQTQLFKYKCQDIYFPKQWIEKFKNSKTLASKKI